MGLISKAVENTKAASQVVLQLDMECISGIRFKDLKLHIGKLAMGKMLYYVSTGNWSMHELLEYILKQTGTADVHITTWAITEEPARNIVRMKQEGYIGTVTCIVDFRMSQRNNKGLQYCIRNFDKVVHAKCHSKTILISNQNWKVHVMSSANMSKNPRIETGVIMCCEYAYNAGYTWITEVLNKGKLMKDYV